ETVERGRRDRQRRRITQPDDQRIAEPGHDHPGGDRRAQTVTPIGSSQRHGQELGRPIARGKTRLPPVPTPWTMPEGTKCIPPPRPKELAYDRIRYSDRRIGRGRADRRLEPGRP